MALILHIETSDKLCSVALSEDEQVIASRESLAERAHASLLTVLIDEMLKSKKIHIKQLSAVSVSKGPGSYTGLRIGVSAAKGICYALNIPLLAVNTLYTMSHGLLRYYGDQVPENSLLCPMIDARRMEVYQALYDESLNELMQTNAAIITEESFLSDLENQNVLFFGSGSAKCISMIVHRNAIFIDDFVCKATYLTGPAFQLFQKQEFADTAYFEPFYLKDFVATTPVKNVLWGNNQVK